MKYSAQIIEKIKKLRSKGKTYSEIKNILNLQIPKSTLSSWCGNIALPSWYENKIKELNLANFRRAQQLALVANKLKLENLVRRLKLNNQVLKRYLKDKNILKMLLAILYLGEGSKWKSHSGLMLGSSDPDIVLLYLRLLRSCYGLFSEQLKCRISYRADQDLKTLERYWSDLTGIPIQNFYKTIPDPRTVGKPTKKLDYKGVCVIMSGNTAIQLELELIPKILLKGLW